jgi:hypothetical protein
MKFAQTMQNIRCKMAVVGLGATLLIANACYAQQETDPDIFAPNPGGSTEIGVASAPNNNDGAFSVASQPAELASSSEPDVATVAQELVSSEFSLLDSTLAIAVAACLTVFGIYALMLVGLKKQKRNSKTSPAARGSRGTMHRAAV